MMRLTACALACMLAAPTLSTPVRPDTESIQAVKGAWTASFGADFASELQDSKEAMSAFMHVARQATSVSLVTGSENVFVESMSFGSSRRGLASDATTDVARLASEFSELRLLARTAEAHATPGEVAVTASSSRRQLAAATCSNHKVTFKDTAGKACSANYFEYNMCASDGCEATTLCPTVFGGSCSACDCKLPGVWQLGAAPTYADLAHAYQRVTIDAGEKAYVLDSSCSAADMAGAKFVSQGQTSSSKGVRTIVCSGSNFNSRSNGITVMESSGASVKSGTKGCNTANSCVTDVIASEVVRASKGDVATYTYKAEMGGDWYEAVVVLYKAAKSPAKNLDTDTPAEMHAVRGNKISASTCPTAYVHAPATSLRATGRSWRPPRRSVSHFSAPRHMQIRSQGLRRQDCEIHVRLRRLHHRQPHCAVGWWRVNVAQPSLRSPIPRLPTPPRPLALGPTRA